MKVTPQAPRQEDQRGQIQPIQSVSRGQQQDRTEDDRRTTMSGRPTLQEVASDTSRVLQQRVHAHRVANSPRVLQMKARYDAIQGRSSANGLPHQPKAGIKRVSGMPMGENHPEAIVQPRLRFRAGPENHTGLLDHLKSGIEQLSGYSLDHVKVHYNSRSQHTEDCSQ